MGRSGISETPRKKNCFDSSFISGSTTRNAAERPRRAPMPCQGLASNDAQQARPRPKSKEAPASSGSTKIDEGVRLLAAALVRPASRPMQLDKSHMH